MGHGHGHGHAHAVGRAEDRRRLVLVLIVTGSVVVVELVGALLSGSLALLADAGHMLSDTAGIILALSASVIAARPSTERLTFGYHRAEILAGMMNAVVLIGIGGWLVYAGVRRLITPGDVDAPQMLIFAAIGMLANLVSLLILISRKDNSLNMRGAYLEVLTDTFGSVAAIAAGLIIWGTGFQRADPIASLVIAALVLPRSWALLREALSILLESTPRGMDLSEVRAHLRGVEGVTDLHNLHAWTITSGMAALSAHVVVQEEFLGRDGVAGVLAALTDCAHEHFDISHVTFQIEPEGHQKREVRSGHR